MALNSRSVEYDDQKCAITTTPLRLLNLNLGIFYLILMIVTIVFGVKRSNVTEPFYDSNLYRLKGTYNSLNRIDGPATAVSLASLSPSGIAYIIATALGICALFHFVYAIDLKRMYTLMLVDKCNAMRWAQIGIAFMLMGIATAELLGSMSMEFYIMAILTLPLIGIFGFFIDKHYPCYPYLLYWAFAGFLMVLIGYWTSVGVTFAYRVIDAPGGPGAIPGYMYMALASLALYSLVLLVGPILMQRTRLNYFKSEIIQTFLLFIMLAITSGSIIWAVSNS